MHQYTFSGSPARCAAAIAAIDVYVNENVAENAGRVGAHIVDRIEKEFMPMPCVGTHSGLGLMLAMEIVADKETKAMFDPPLAPIMPVLDEARRRGLHLRQMGSNRIVIAPPCTTTDRGGGRDRRHPEAAGGRHQAAGRERPGGQAKKRVQGGSSRGEWHVPGGDDEQTQEDVDHRRGRVAGAAGRRLLRGLRNRVEQLVGSPGRPRR